MSRPQESDYASHVAYARALEDYCDKLEMFLPTRREAEAAKAAERVLDANKAWGEYQTRMGIMRVFDEDAK